MKVLKFGGTSVETAERIKNLANIVKTAQQDHTKLIVVVSALAKVTDLLIKAAGQAVTNRDNALQTVEIIREKYRDVYQAELQHADVNASFENLFVELDGHFKRDQSHKRIFCTDTRFCNEFWRTHQCFFIG